MSDSATILRRLYADVDNPAKTADDLAGYFADEFRDFDRHAGSPEALSDKQAHLAFFIELKSGFTDYEHTLNLLERSESGRFLVYWTFSGIHSGTFFGVPASGRRVAANGIDIYTMSGEKISEQRHCEDVAGLMSQISN